jgi:hypothetical protein
MSLHPECERQVMALGGNDSIKRGLLDIFKATVQDTIIQGLPNGTCVIPFYDKDSDLKPGDWAAELHCVVRQVESVNEDGDPNVHPQANPEDAT